MLGQTDYEPMGGRDAGDGGDRPPPYDSSLKVWTCLTSGMTHRYWIERGKMKGDDQSELVLQRKYEICYFKIYNPRI